MAKQENQIEIINLKDRSYNGITKNTIISIDESELQEYLSVGFEVIRNKALDTEEKTVKPNREEIIAELTALGVEFKPVGSKTVDLAALLAKSKESV